VVAGIPVGGGRKLVVAGNPVAGARKLALAFLVTGVA